MIYNDDGNTVFYDARRLVQIHDALQYVRNYHTKYVEGGCDMINNPRQRLKIWYKMLLLKWDLNESGMQTQK